MLTVADNRLFLSFSCASLCCLSLCRDWLVACALSVVPPVAVVVVCVPVTFDGAGSKKGPSAATAKWRRATIRGPDGIYTLVVSRKQRPRFCCVPFFARPIFFGQAHSAGADQPRNGPFSVP
nr:hypothetical protein [Pandoravirus aubagnensis]